MDTAIGLVYLAIFIFILFLCREIACWYLKTTEVVELLKEIRDLLKKPAMKIVNNSFEQFCRHCGERVAKEAKECPFCREKF